jgi:hypothetical protein
LWAGVLMPVAVFVSAVLISLRFTGAVERILVCVTGWALVAALSVSFSEIEQAIRAQALMAVLG